MSYCTIDYSQSDNILGYWAGLEFYHARRKYERIAYYDNISVVEVYENDH